MGSPWRLAGTRYYCSGARERKGHTWRRINGTSSISHHAWRTRSSSISMRSEHLGGCDRRVYCESSPQYGGAKIGEVSLPGRAARNRHIRRTLATFLVVSLSLAFAGPTLTGQSESQRCHHSVPLGFSVLSPAHDADCDHGSAHHCAVLGCVTVGPALASPQTQLSALPGGDRDATAGSPHLVVRLTTGPPTPPPNS